MMIYYLLSTDLLFTDLPIYGFTDFLPPFFYFFILLFFYFSKIGRKVT